MKQWTMTERRLFILSVAVMVFFAVDPTVMAMHIMEGYLPPFHSIGWGAVCIPFLVIGMISIRHLAGTQRKTVVLLAMAGAYIFVLSSLKIPSVTGSCSHMTGTGLAAILFGVPVTSILGIIVLLFQAVLLAHGGLTTLGANTFSMAIAGPLMVFVLYQLGKKLKLNRSVNIFIAAALGDIITYCVTSLQLAFAYPSAKGGFMASAVKFLAVFAPTQLPLAIIEGILTVLIVMGLESLAMPELRSINFLQEGKR
ncbi:MAG: energy-coupling factor ABC transporter permease [Lachnospiraceae bacterium]|nr:energy-coupling factor ABC transporter permease [Lachnospiraceae bacterium]MDY5741870.1 energy-coupling factor ABC transporter permease [Lachnospiraceae bacterium]